MWWATKHKTEMEDFKLKHIYLPPMGFCHRKGPVAPQNCKDPDIPHRLELLGLQQDLAVKVLLPNESAVPVLEWCFRKYHLLLPRF